MDPFDEATRAARSAESDPPATYTQPSPMETLNNRQGSGLVQRRSVLTLPGGNPRHPMPERVHGAVVLLLIAAACVEKSPKRSSSVLKVVSSLNTCPRGCVATAAPKEPAGKR